MTTSASAKVSRSRTSDTVQQQARAAAEARHEELGHQVVLVEDEPRAAQP